VSSESTRRIELGDGRSLVARAEDAVPAREVLLATLLRDPVRRERLERRLLGGGHGALAVAGAAGRREDHLRLAGGRQHVRGADDVHRGVVARILHRGLHVGLRSQVEEDVRVDRERLADVVLEQRRRRIHELALPGREVVDDGHLVAAREERIDEIRPDEARTTCHDRVHGGRRLEEAMFVTFEGVDWSGKSTQAMLLAEWLRGEGRTVIATREPGGTTVAEGVRDLVQHGAHMAPWAEAALYAAARADHAAQVIRPALERGDDVVCDRYLDSSVAYQGIARGLGEERVRELSLIVTEGLLPDRTFLVLLDPDEALGRATGDHDRIEREGAEFMQKVDAGYRALAAADPDRIVAVDGARPPDTIAEEIREHVRPLL
jgi:dTMP kinase